MPKKITSYTVGHPIAFNKYNTIFKDIDERVNALEDHLPKNGLKPDVSRIEKLALLIELDIVDYLHESKKMSQKAIAYLLAPLLNNSAVNIEKDLSERYNPESHLKSRSTYKFLIDAFKSAKLKKYVDLFEKKLESLESLAE